jgi:hypothetical protein
MKLVAFHILNRFGLADPDALGVAFTQIAFVRESQIRIKTHGSGGAGGDAHFASYAKGFVQDHPVDLRVTTNSAFRACSRAGGINALLACDGQEKTLRIMAAPKNLNAWLRALFLPGVPHGACEFALPASVAHERVNGKRFGSDHFRHLSSMNAALLPIRGTTSGLLGSGLLMIPW